MFCSTGTSTPYNVFDNNNIKNGTLSMHSGEKGKKTKKTMLHQLHTQWTAVREYKIKERIKGEIRQCLETRNLPGRATSREKRILIRRERN